MGTKVKEYDHGIEMSTTDENGEWKIAINTSDGFQLQVENQFDNCFVDLSLQQLKALRDMINTAINKKTITKGECLEQRIIRQRMGESFLMWAEEYYSDGEDTKLNKSISRRDILKSYLNKFPHERKFTSPQKFREKLLAYCQWKGYKFNPHRYDSMTGLPMYFDKYGNPDINDKSGGVEYYTIGKVSKGRAEDNMINLNYISGEDAERLSSYLKEVLKKLELKADF